MDCLFPTCQRHPQSNGYCLFHQMYSNSASVKLAKAIPKQSDTRKEVNKELKKKYTLFLSKPENKYCKIQFTGCTHVATVVHHTRGREGDQLLNEADWMPSCPNCNLQVEINDAAARKAGVKKSKFSPKQS